MALKDYKIISQEKLASNAAKIPAAWRLPATYLKNVNADAAVSVLDVPRTCGILTNRELRITEDYDATALVEAIASRQLSSCEVVLAFCKRAAIAHQLVNCLTEILFEEALERAKACDEHLQRTGTTLGPLHGLPVSVKDSFSIKGSQTTMAYIAFVSNSPDDFSSSSVEILLAAGAICHVKTNIPQTMWCCDSVNNVFGRTLNPHKLCLTAGGSTGGEGALLAMRGSIVGIGTDIGGSVRTPALCNGIVAFKPSASRFPFAGQVADIRAGNPKKILASLGPMGHTFQDMDLIMRVMSDAEPWLLDEDMIDVPWRRVQQTPKRLRFGLITEQHLRPLHPPMLRTIKTAEQTLANAGHEIINIDDKIPSLWESAILAWKYFSLDKTKFARKLLEDAGEPVVKSLDTCRFPELDDWVPDLEKLWEMNVQRSEIRKAFHDVFVDDQLDGIIMPVYQTVAPLHDTMGVPIYTVLANMLDYPAAAIPYLDANKELDKAYLRANVTYEPPYDASAFEGAPCGIQIMGRPMKDEELVHIAATVAEALGSKN